MTCNTTEQIRKTLGEDWIFSFIFEDEDGNEIDLTGYTYDYILQRKGVIIKQGTDAISGGTELLVVIEETETTNYQSGTYYYEIKVTDTNGISYIAEKQPFYATDSLHSS